MASKGAATPLGVISWGGVAGLTGALLLTALDWAMQSVLKDESQSSVAPGYGPEVLVNPATSAENVATIFAEKVGSGLFSGHLGERRWAAGEAVHFTYGGLWGAVYGIVQGSLGLPPWLAGPVHGLVIWAVGPVVMLPAMRIAPAPWRVPPDKAALAVGAHLVYGLATALVYEAEQRAGGGR